MKTLQRGEGEWKEILCSEKKLSIDAEDKPCYDNYAVMKPCCDEAML